MSELSIQVAPLRSRFLVGESVQVRTSIRNQSPGLLEVPSAAGPSPFIYSLLATEAKEHSFELSERLRWELRHRDAPLGPSTLAPFVLGPGYAVSRVEDLTDLASRAIPAGAYTLTAAFSSGAAIHESAPVRVEIVPARPEWISSHVSAASEQVVTVFAQREDAEVALLAGQASLLHPEWSVFHRLRASKRPAQVEAVAASVSVEKVCGWRWVSWLSDRRLCAMQVREANPGEHEMPVHLEEARLLSPGFWRSDGRALFLVAGVAQGGARLAAFSFSESDANQLWEVPLADSLPGRLLPVLGGTGPLRVAGFEPAGVGGWLWVAEFSPEDGKGAPARELGALTAPFLAWGEAQDGGALYVLSGPDPTGRYACSRFTMQGEPQGPAEMTLPPLTSAARSWALAPLASGEVVVLGAVEDRLMLARLPKDQTWRVVAQPVQQAGFLMVFPDPEGTLWAEWVDPAFGIKFARASPL